MIAQQEVEVQHCPTQEMWSDILTKPKQGKDFILMHSKLLGCNADEATSGDAPTQMRADKNSVTRRAHTLLSPRGCVGPEVHTVSKKVPKLRVEGIAKLGRRKLVEPGRRFFVTQRRATAACE